MSSVTSPHQDCVGYGASCLHKIEECKPTFPKSGDPPIQHFFLSNSLNSRTLKVPCVRLGSIVPPVTLLTWPTPHILADQRTKYEDVAPREGFIVEARCDYCINLSQETPNKKALRNTSTFPNLFSLLFPPKIPLFEYENDLSLSHSLFFPQESFGNLWGPKMKRNFPNFHFFWPQQILSEKKSHLNFH